MAAQEDATWNLSPDCFHRATQPLLVTFGAAARRRSVRPQLSEQQIAAENGQPGFAESRRKGHE